MNLVKINQNGQVSIPARLRRKLGLSGGDWVQIQEEVSGKIMLIPMMVRPKNKELDLKKYEAMGVDIGLLMMSLARTPTERAKTNYEMLLFKEESRKAREKLKNGHS